jgi:Fic family protein
MSYLDKRNEIDTLQQKINSYGELSADVKKKINYKFRLDWNYYSNSMEGNTLTMDETRSVMVGNLTVGGKPIKDVLEMKGHDEVIAEIMKIGKGEMRLSEARIREIHKGIMHEEDEAKKNKIGRWKTAPNHVINYKGEKFDFALPEDVPERMHDLLNKTNAAIDSIQQKKKPASWAERDARHPIDVALQFHLDYVLIHPFYDGNGRTARILTNLLLISFGFPPFWVRTNERNIYNQYIADIQGYGGKSDLFYDFAAGLILRSQQLVLDAIEGRDIEEPEDLDKKIALLKNKLGEEKEVSVHIRFGNEAINRVVKQTIIPLAFAWEEKLKKFDALFISRKVDFVVGDKTYQTNAFDAQFEKKWHQFLASSLSLTNKKIILRSHPRGLRSVDNGVSINAGEITIELFENAYEVTYTKNNKKFNKLYHQNLSEKEIAKIANDLGTFLYNNIEQFIESKKKDE